MDTINKITHKTLKVPGTKTDIRLALAGELMTMGANGEPKTHRALLA